LPSSKLKVQDEHIVLPATGGKKWTNMEHQTAKVFGHWALSTIFCNGLEAEKGSVAFV
jgi:hypothetical protein